MAATMTMRISSFSYKGWRRRLGFLVFSLLFSSVYTFTYHARSWRRSTSRIFSRSKEDTTVKPPSNQTTRFINYDQIHDLKQSIDIVSVIEKFHLKGFRRTSDNKAIAICPFHDDKNPSLNIDGNRQIYKCFACGEGGDIFRFVREYGKLQGKELSFWQAVKYVTEDSGIELAGLSGSSKPRMSEEERQEIVRKKERILAANAAAAAFYLDCLTKPFAGAARYHLQARGLTPATARAFALGFAPDAYYGPGRSTTWGWGSLVEHLKGLGFSPIELLDAGLAIRTKKAEATSIDEPVDQALDDAKKVQHSMNDTNSDNFGYSSLMDRFRARLVVPIFDASGTHVLGFGGRILAEEEPNSSFYNPKYLNSPESLVFQKKNILFGHHLAAQAIRDSKTKMGDHSMANIVIVEGYMDAMALWTVGVETVMASMGTAISSGQLSLAARAVDSGGGRVILCLDNDEAGVAAVERLCSNGMLLATVEKFPADVAIASIPKGMKDPAEFIEARAAEGLDAVQIADRFQKEVMEAAMDWIDWYMSRILKTYDPTAARGHSGSFGDIFERLADFLAVSLNPGDRTKRAYEVAGTLAQIMATESNATQVSTAVRNQLESDLIDLASRMAQAKEVVKRRSEAVDGQSSIGSRSILSSLVRGEGPSTVADVEKLSRKALASATESNEVQRTTSPSTRSLSHQRGREKSRFSRNRTFRPTKRQGSRLVTKSLTPHFSGFRFARRSDEEWLRISTKKVAGFGRRRDSEKPVYFNSNEYHGHQFLTEEAIQAGYSSRAVRRDPALVEKGVASLVELDLPHMAQAAEDSFLQALVQDSRARTVTKNMMDARSAVSSDAVIRWSCPSKQWLFECLVHRSDGIPLYCNDTEQLRAYLADLPDAPPGAFKASNSTSDLDTNDSSVGNGVTTELSDKFGILDRYFGDDNEGLPVALQEETVTSEILGELYVQELLATLLWASTAHRAHEIRKKLAAASVALNGNSERLEQDDSELTGLPSVDPVESDTEVKKTIELSEEYEELRDISRTLHALAESSKRIASRLMDQAGTDGLEGRISTALQAELSQKLDDYVDNLVDLPLAGDDDEQESESYEDALERMEEDWGEWTDEDFVWSSAETANRAAHNNGQSQYSVDYSDNPEVVDEETLDEVMERISREWSEWDS